MIKLNRYPYYYYAAWLVILATLNSCSPDEANADRLIGEYPDIFPDYAEVTVAPNLAAPRFWLSDTAVYVDAQAVFAAGTVKCVIPVKGGGFALDGRQWQEMRQQSDTVTVTVLTSDGKAWSAYKPFNIYVAPDSIDSFIAYRLIEPGYETWNEMGIYQRCLENYREVPIITNRQTDYGCINCHSFCRQDPDKMLMHLRVEHGGTYVIDDGDITKLNTKTPETISALVYPSWHPSGDFVAFSVNDTKQMFHTSDPNRIEVFDYASDVVVYDVNRHELVTSPLLRSDKSFETFPTFSPDGKTLYYCTADSTAMPEGYDRLRYSICSVSFDPMSRTFGTAVDTLYDAVADGHSASFPRVSPDGRRLMFTKSGYGNFSIWHRDADLYMIDLRTREVMPLTALNSPETESYHTWSSNGRWVVYSSRRLDGLYTRPYIAYIDADGNARKPLVLPPPTRDYYTRLMKSYNVPEFITGPVTVSGHDISEVAKHEPGINVTYVGD